MFGGNYKKRKVISHRGASKQSKTRDQILKEAEKARLARSEERIKLASALVIQSCFRRHLQRGRVRDAVHEQATPPSPGDLSGFIRFLRATLFCFDPSHPSTRDRFQTLLLTLAMPDHPYVSQGADCAELTSAQWHLQMASVLSCCVCVLQHGDCPALPYLTPLLRFSMHLLLKEESGGRKARGVVSFRSLFGALKQALLHEPSCRDVLQACCALVAIAIERNPRVSIEFMQELLFCELEWTPLMISVLYRATLPALRVAAAQTEIGAPKGPRLHGCWAMLLESIRDGSVPVADRLVIAVRPPLLTHT